MPNYLGAPIDAEIRAAYFKFLESGEYRSFHCPKCQSGYLSWLEDHAFACDVCHKHGFAFNEQTRAYEPIEVDDELAASLVKHDKTKRKFQDWVIQARQQSE
jgi:hypothetical protein